MTTRLMLAKVKVVEALFAALKGIAPSTRIFVASPPLDADAPLVILATIATVIASQAVQAYLGRICWITWKWPGT
mgnify:CR=1 FL=1